MRGDDAVVEDVLDVGLRGEAAQGAGVILRDGGLDGGDAEVLIAPGEMGAGGGNAEFGVTGNGCVAIEEEVAVGSDAAGVDLASGDLGADDRCNQKCQDKNFPEGAVADRTCSRNAKSGHWKNRVTVNEHGWTSLLR